jgi:hypothetical protein
MGEKASGVQDVHQAARDHDFDRLACVAGPDRTS